MLQNRSSRSFFVVLAMFLSVFSGVIPARAAVTVLHHYRMGENDPFAQPGAAASTAADPTGAQPLTLSGGPVYSSDVDSAAAGRVPSTLSLDFGPGAYGTNTLISTVTDNFGFEAWIKPTSLAGSHVIAYNGNPGSSGWGLELKDGTYRLLFGGVIFTNGGAPVNNVWTHVALVRDNGVAKFYVNGVAAITTTLAPNPPVGSFAVATVPGAGGNYWTGKLDELRFFTFTAGQFSTNDLLLNRPAPPAAYFAPVWKKANVPAVSWTAIASSAYGNKLVAGAYQGQIYTSSDYGASWRSNNFGAAILYNCVASSADGSVLVVAPYGGNLRVSTNSGATWTARDSARNWSAVACSSDGTKMVAVANTSFYTSTDTGATWSPQAAPVGVIGLASSADGSKLAAVVNGGNVYISSNSGTNWDARASSQLWTAVTTSADGSKLLAVLDLNSGLSDFLGGLSRSGDSGASWSDPVNEQTGLTFTGAASSSDGTRLAVCARGYGTFYPPGLILTSVDSGSTWEVAFAPMKRWSGVASSADGTRLAAAYFGDCNNCTEGGIYTYVGPDAAPAANPVLNILQQSGSAALSWPYPSTGYVLQQNANPATTNWVNTTNTPAVVNQVTGPATNGQNFYRLYKP